jgi:aquaporin Z
MITAGAFHVRKGAIMPASRSRIAVAEAIGTFVLILGGVGTAVLATGGFFGEGSVGVLGVALAFGLALLVMAYAIGNISGCHINPAVTVGLVLARKLSPRELPTYLGGQLVGGVAGGLAIWAIAAGAAGGFDPSPANFAVNGWGELSPGGFGLASVAIAEILLTALLVFVVLSTTHRRFVPVAGGLAVGLTLALIHIISIPVSNTSVNPVRSLAAAVFAGGDALVQLWAFIVFPLAGAALGAIAWMFLDEPEREPEVRIIDVDEPVVESEQQEPPIRT